MGLARALGEATLQSFGEAMAHVILLVIVVILGLLALAAAYSTWELLRGNRKLGAAMLGGLLLALTLSRYLGKGWIILYVMAVAAVALFRLLAAAYHQLTGPK